MLHWMSFYFRRQCSRGARAFQTRSILSACDQSAPILTDRHQSAPWDVLPGGFSNPKDPKAPTDQLHERHGQTHIRIPQRVYEDQSAWDQSGLADMDASFVVRRWSHLPDHVAGQPNRRGHDGHVLKLDIFLQKVGKQPSRLCNKVEKKRGNEDDPMVSIQV